jgi:hypothetical protein
MQLHRAQYVDTIARHIRPSLRQYFAGGGRRIQSVLFFSGTGSYHNSLIVSIFENNLLHVDNVDIPLRGMCAALSGYAQAASTRP